MLSYGTFIIGDIDVSARSEILFYFASSLFHLLHKAFYFVGEFFVGEFFFEALGEDGEAEGGELLYLPNDDALLRHAVEGGYHACFLHLEGHHLVIGLLQQQVVLLVVRKHGEEQLGVGLHVACLYSLAGIAGKHQSRYAGYVAKLTLCHLGYIDAVVDVVRDIAGVK